MGKGIERFNAILAEQVAALRAEVEEINATMERLKAERRAVLGLLGELEKFRRRAVPPNGTAPWGPVLNVMDEGKVYRIPELASLTGRTPQSVQAAVAYQMQRGTVRRVGYGRYQKVETPDVANADASQENGNA